MTLPVLQPEGQEPAPPRRYYIETWGCQMNELDSQRMAGQLMEQGLLPTRSPDEADVILLNSCSVREKAEQKVHSRLGAFRGLKEAKPELRIGLCGCVAQQVGKRALSRSSHLDFVLGPARVGELTEVLERRRSGERVVATGFPEEREYAFDSIARDGEHGSYKGMVTIIEGCNKKCTFCIVPSTRGPERCRPLAEVLAEVRHLLDFGFVEIELLGQTVNHWREPEGGEHRGADFADLLDAVASLPGLPRLRFVTSYPRDFTPAMVAQFRRHENICPYLHLPVQSGSNRILKLMGRGYERGPYLELMEQIKAARPGINLSTDIIVGFPGETEDDFAQTLELLEAVRYGSVFAFIYSPRPGTAAPRLKESVAPPVDPQVASDRLQRLFALQTQIQTELNQALVGSRQEVLVTGWSKQGGSLMGRTGCHRIVHFPADAEAEPGTLVQVRVERANPHSLMGVRLQDGLPTPAVRPARLPVIAS